MKLKNNSKFLKIGLYIICFVIFSSALFYSSSLSFDSRISAFCREITHCQKNSKENFTNLVISNDNSPYYSKDDNQIYRAKILNDYRFVYSKNNKAQFYNSQNQNVFYESDDGTKNMVSAVYPYHLTTKNNKLEFLDIPLLCQNPENLNYISGKYSSLIPAVISYQMACQFGDGGDPLSAIDKTIVIQSNVNGTIDYREIVVWNVSAEIKSKNTTPFNDYLSSLYEGQFVILDKPIFNESIRFNISLGNDVYLNELLINDCINSFKNHSFHYATPNIENSLDTLFRSVLNSLELPYFVFCIIYLIAVLIVFFLLFRKTTFALAHDGFLYSVISLFVHFLPGFFSLMFLELIYKKTGLFVIFSMLNKYSVIFVLLVCFLSFVLEQIIIHSRKAKQNSSLGLTDYEK